MRYPPVNLDYLLEIFDHDYETIRDVYEVFLLDSESIMKNLECVIREEKFEEISPLAHTLKGSLQLIAAEDASTIANDLQVSGTGSERNSQELSSRVRVLHNLLEDIKLFFSTKVLQD